MKVKFKQSKKKNPKLWFKPVKLNTKKSVKFIPIKHLTWSQASIKYPNLKAYGDADKDGVFNRWDCKPFNPKRQGPDHRKHNTFSAKEEAEIRKALDESPLRAIEEDFNTFSLTDSPSYPGSRRQNISQALANEKKKQERLRMQINELQSRVDKEDQDDQVGWFGGQGADKASINITDITKDSRRMRKLESTSKSNNKEQSAQSLIDDVLKD